VRSFSYAAHAALASYLARRPQDADTLEPWARLWSKFASAGVSGQLTARSRPGALFFPRTATSFARLLDASLVDKAFYELGTNFGSPRGPTWARIPLQGSARLVREPVVKGARARHQLEKPS